MDRKVVGGKRQNHMNRSTPAVLGIDVAKAELVCTLLGHDRKTLWNKTFPNSQAGWQRLLQSTPPAASLVLEPTGRYSVGIAKTAMAAKRVVLMAPPRRAKSFLASIQSRAKTDLLDSQGLALFALSQPLAPYPIKSEAVEKMHQLLSARKSIALSISRLSLQAKELPFAAAALKEAIAALKVQHKALEKQIQAQAKTSPEFCRMSALRKVPGIGPVTAAALASELSGRRFSSPDKFVAYVGLDISVVQSGTRKGERGLSKQGDAELRRLLYLCAQSNLRCKSSPFKTQYERERGKGLSSTRALCAVARKLAKVCWSIYMHETVYDAERVFTQARSAKSIPAPQEESAFPEKST